MGVAGKRGCGERRDDERRMKERYDISRYGLGYACQLVRRTGRSQGAGSPQTPVVADSVVSGGGHRHICTLAQTTAPIARVARDRNGKKRAPCMNKLHTTTSTNQGLQLSKTKIKDARQRTRDEDDTLLCSKEHMRWPPLPLPHCSTRLHAGAAIAASRSAASIASSSSSGSSTAAPPRPTTASLWLCLCAGRGRFKPGPPSPE